LGEVPVERQRGVVEALLSAVVLVPRGRGMREMRPEHVRLTWMGEEERPRLT
jgi:hypothetical protein